jgi:hypothetical protein
MRTRGAAEWAGWICKERGSSLHPDVQRQVVREHPAGKPAGFFSFWAVNFQTNYLHNSPHRTKFATSVSFAGDVCVWQHKSQVSKQRSCAISWPVSDSRRLGFQTSRFSDVSNFRQGQTHRKVATQSLRSNEASGFQDSGTAGIQPAGCLGARSSPRGSGRSGACRERY